MPVPSGTLSGNSTEVGIDQANIAMRSMPWYQDLLRSMGVDPNRPINLSDNQRRQVLRGAQQNGFVIDEGDMQIDGSGNIDKKGHALRNTLIVAGIAGATIATMGAAGAFAGGAAAGGAGAGAGGAAAGAGTLASTTIGTGMLGPIAGGTGLAAGAGAAGAGAGTLSTAAKIGGLLSGGKGATGYLDTAGRVADAIGAASSGRAAGRATEAQLAQGANRNIIDLYRAQQDAANSENAFGLNKVSAGIGVGNLDLNQKQFSLDAPGKRASNSVRGDILANAQDAVGSGISPNIPVPTITGGLRPSMFSANTRALGGEMSSQALASQKAGDQFAPLPTLPDYKAGPAAPSLTDVPQAGKLDSILNVASSIGGLMGSIPYKRTPQPGDPDYIPQPYVARR